MEKSELTAPVFQRDLMETLVVGHIERHQGQLMLVGNGGDLPVGKWRRVPLGSQAGAFSRVPGSSSFIVRQDRHRWGNNCEQEAFDSRPPGRIRQAPAAEPQLVPGGG